MKRIGRCLVMALAVMWFSGIAYAGNTAGVFRLPYNPAQQWNVQGCTNVGFTDISPNGLVFLELNTTLPSGSKYHLAEDWNGLYVARLMIEAHHGRIWAESEGEGRGAKFYFEVPVGE